MQKQSCGGKTQDYGKGVSLLPQHQKQRLTRFSSVCSGCLGTLCLLDFLDDRFIDDLGSAGGAIEQAKVTDVVDSSRHTVAGTHHGCVCRRSEKFPAGARNRQTMPDISDDIVVSEI